MEKADVFQLIRLGNNEKLLSVLDSVDIDQLNDHGQNLLHEAVSSGNEKAAKELIKRNVNVNQQDSKGQSPLHYAALHNQKVMAALIIENGGDLHVADAYGNQPLWTAVFNARGNYDLVELYVLSGAIVDHPNNAGRSPLDFGTQIRDQYLMGLLEKGKRSR